MFSKIILDLFSKLNEENVTYCHWKSTEHLAASFEAKTDLDVLVSRYHARTCESVLLAVGFVRARTPDARTYPCVEDYLFYDAELQRWIHFHMHYQLPCGDRWVKSYRTPIEDYLLQNRVYLKQYNIYNIDPVSEYLFFITRMHMKWATPIKKSSVLQENEFLAQLLKDNGINSENLKSHFVKHPLCVDGTFAIAEAYFLKSPESISSKQVNLFQKQLLVYRRMGRLTFFRLNISRYLLRLHIEFYRRILKDYSFGRRAIVNGSRLFSFVGMDGSGKSTMIDEVYREMGKQLNVTRIFLGTGRSGAGLFRKFIFIIYDFKSKKNRSTATENKGIKKISLGKLFWIYLCLRDRNKELTKLHRSAANGNVVLIDRWPQRAITDFADAPKLAEYVNAKGLAGYLARREADFYTKIESINIDKHLLFDIQPETSLKRKPNELTLDLAIKYREVMHNLRADIYKNCDFIDAEKSYGEVKNKVCKIVWNTINGR